MHAHEAIWVSSSVLLIEIGRNPDTERLRDVTALCAFANEMVTAGPAIAQRAIELQQLGFGSFDSLHLASAEAGHATVFLTTDDALLRRARRQREKLHVAVDNPVSWYRRRKPWLIVKN